MKTVLACLVLAVLTVSIQANGFHGGGRDGSGPFNKGFGLLGWLLDSSDSGERGCSCTRPNPCRRVSGTAVLGCPNTNKFIQCSGAVCTNQTCPSGQVWNKAQNACAACATGMHVAANLQACVCDKGTTLDPITKACVTCPTGSTQDPDRCYCSITTSYDPQTNACRACPATATITRSQQCQCLSTAPFFNAKAWTCNDCPGQWSPPKIVKKTVFNAPLQKCVCSGTNMIFDRPNVKCYTCPSGTTASFDSCVCQNRLMVFNLDTEKCGCRKGYVADSAGTGCVFAPPNAQSTVPTAAGSP
jgi:hypothetical protein